MSSLKVSQLSPSGYRRTPWKNGGGVAIDIAGASIRGAAPGAWDSTLWSFGRTSIVKAAPFSDLSGLDRMQMVVEGRGLVLECASGEIDLRQPGHAVRFSGHTPIVSKLESGPVEVVNLIGLHERVSLDLRTLEPQSTATPRAGDHVIYAAFEPCAVSCDGITYAIPYDHALLVACDEEVALCSDAGRAVIASVFKK